MTAYNLSPGRTWVTGESVTATKMNTAMTGSTITITNNLIGQASSTTNYIPQWSDGSGALLKEGKELVTAPVDGSSTDDQIPTAQSVHETIDALGVTGTNSGSTGAVTLGGIKIYWATGDPTNTQGEETITIAGGVFSGTPYTVLVSTNNTTGTAQADSFFQVKSFTSTLVTLYNQQPNTNTVNVTPTVLVIGPA
jgi:hypothetical protein